jgi:hypothetical protein
LKKLKKNLTARRPDTRIAQHQIFACMEIADANRKIKKSQKKE